MFSIFTCWYFKCYICTSFRNSCTNTANEMAWHAESQYLYLTLLGVILYLNASVFPFKTLATCI